jgi:hypothetical protein
VTYAITPHAYLSRARKRLTSTCHEDLFYAAFELRCCIESRQADYLEALEKYRGSKIKPWRVAEGAKRLLHVWDQPRISELIYELDGRDYPTYFTPVKPELARAAERDIGMLMHAQSMHYPPDDPWWAETKSRLVEIYREAWVACQGEHMSPPLWNACTGEAHPARLYVTPASEELLDRLSALAQSGRTFKVRVAYFDEPPPHWRCNL